MIFYEALTAYREQLKRHTGLKVVLAPSVLKESDVTVKIAVRRPLIKNNSMARGPAATLEKTLKLFVTLEGVIESEVGLKYALAASESLQEYFAVQRNLEDATGKGIPNSRITISADESDSILEDPESGAKAWTNEAYSVEITIP
jgi:hypothetical protein